MGVSHRSVSHLWGLSRHKLSLGRSSAQPRRDTVRSVDSHTLAAAVRSEHADGFYMYSQEELEKEARQRQARSSGSSEMTYVSARSVPEGRPSLPYTVSSLDWNIFSDAVRDLDETTDDTTIWHDSVRSVFTRVYAVAKIVLIILLHYGVEVEDLPDGILAHVHHAESVTASSSIIDLIDATENLYYPLYARLVMEMANADLCAQFELDTHHLAGTKQKKGFTLPEPGHLRKIFHCCREILDAPTVCRSVSAPIIRQYQAEYIRRALDQFPSGHIRTDDLLGYRAHMLSSLVGRNSFQDRWRRDARYEMPPVELLTILSERYLAFLPQAAMLTPSVTVVDAGIPAAELPFLAETTVEGISEDRELIRDHRQATLARLEDRAIGEVRREDGFRRVSEYVRRRKCVCRSMCLCASDCTADPERACPCAERMLRLAVAQRQLVAPGAFGIGVRCTSLAKAVFEAVASIRRDVDDFEIAVELDRGVDLFGEILWEGGMEKSREMEKSMGMG